MVNDLKSFFGWKYGDGFHRILWYSNPGVPWYAPYPAIVTETFLLETPYNWRREGLYVSLTIEIPTNQEAAILDAARRRGMSPEEWLLDLAARNVASSASGLPLRPISDTIAEIMKDVPKDVLKALPHDGASQVDHYVYGHPKR